MRQYFMVYCYSKDCYNGASAEHDNMKFIHCAKASDMTLLKLVVCICVNQQRQQKKQNTRQVCMQLKD